MSNNDEFDLRELLGEDGEEPIPVVSIEDVPASQLPTLGVMTDKQVEKKVAKEEPSPTAVAMARPDYISNGHKTETLSHPVAPNVPIDKIPEAPIPISQVVADPDLTPDPNKPETEEELDSEYFETFNATIPEVKDLEPEVLLDLYHRLARMIRRAKIQRRAIKVTYEGKIQFIDAKRLKALRDKDAEFENKRRRVAERDATKVVKGKSSNAGLSQVEKQVKQFVKLNMNDETIRTTLVAVGTAIPNNLSEMIARFRK